MLTVDTISRLRIRAAQAEGVGQRATASDLRFAADELSRLDAELDAELAAIRLAPRPLARSPPLLGRLRGVERCASADVELIP
jgi:hypothetical protein